MEEFKLQVRFGDKKHPQTYLSPDVRTQFPGWGDEQFNRPIEEVIFFLPGNRFIVMSGMEKYNFFVECVKGMSRDSVKIEAIYLLGKVPHVNKVLMWKIDKSYVNFKEVPFGKEYNEGPTRGWKGGMKGKPNTQIVRV
jgi:hypothetical protein